MATQKIKLNFINLSKDTNNSSVVVFQKNVAESFDELAVAWRVIENCGRLDNHPFTFSLDFKVSAADSYGNFTPAKVAYNGQSYEMVKDPSGNVLKLSDKPATNPNEVEIRNSMETGAVDGNIIRDGKVIASKTTIAPGQKAVFQFQPTIWIGAVSQIDEGDVMKSAIIQTVNRELPLYGISSADIVMTGGGPDKSSTPFVFNLENINKAQ
jgi:hypothetical protein